MVFYENMWEPKKVAKFRIENVKKFRNQLIEVDSFFIFKLTVKNVIYRLVYLDYNDW